MLEDHLWNSNQIEITPCSLYRSPPFSILMGEMMGNDGEKQRSMTGITTPVSSWSVMLARFPAPLYMQPCFLYRIIRWYLVLPTTVIITPQVREPR